MRHFLLITIALCYAGFAEAQKYSETTEILSNIEGDGASFDGRIILNDGTVESGTITYNDRTAVVSFKSDAKTGTYSARSLAGFEFYDHSIDQDRKFFSMEYEMRNGGARTSHFFEIIREYKTFAVVIKLDPIAIRKRVGVVEAVVGGNYEKTRVVVSNAMTVYFFNEDLSIRPYLEVSSKSVSHINKLWGWDIYSGESTKVRILDYDLPKILMGDKYKEVVSYMKKNKLHWDQKDELIQVLDYYNSLVAE